MNNIDTIRKLYADFTRGDVGSILADGKVTHFEDAYDTLAVAAVVPSYVSEQVRHRSDSISYF